MVTETVRVSQETATALRELAEQHGKSAQAILDEAVEQYRRKLWCDEFNAAYERLRADPVAWQEELEERRLWDCTLMDGLRDDPWEEPDVDQ